MAKIINQTPRQLGQLWHFIDPNKATVGFGSSKPYEVAYCGVYFQQGLRQGTWETCETCLKKITKMPKGEWEKSWLERKKRNGQGSIAQLKLVQPAPTAKLRPLLLEVFKFFNGKTERKQVRLRWVQVFKFKPPVLHEENPDLWMGE